MKYIKSRIDIREAAKHRLAETNAVLEQSRQALDPIMVEYNIKTPEEIVERLLEAQDKGQFKSDDGIKDLINTLTRYTRAKGARGSFQFVVDHIADFGEHQQRELKLDRETYPIEWHYIEMDEDEVSYYFDAYEALQESPHHYSREKALGVRGTNIARLHQLIGPSDAMGMATALQR